MRILRQIFFLPVIIYVMIPTVSKVWPPIIDLVRSELLVLS